MKNYYYIIYYHDYIMVQQNKKWYVNAINGVSSNNVHYDIAVIDIKYIFDLLFLLFSKHGIENSDTLCTMGGMYKKHQGKGYNT